MFVPCDEEGNVLDEPYIENYIDVVRGDKTTQFNRDLEQYQKAKDRVLFEGFEVEREYGSAVHFKSKGISSIYYKEENYYHYFGKKHKTVESMVAWTIFLNPSALQKIGLNE